MDEKINKVKESVFWIELEKIKPNPFQPRREFDEAALKELSESIREYGVLQPIVVTRKEISGSGVGSALSVEYELLAGERRFRAANLAGLPNIPAIIRENTTDKAKLEIALIENLQREDLNPMEKAFAFKKLIDDFGMLQREVAARVGKSREAVANTLRLLMLPEEMRAGVASAVITEGHTRPLLMLSDHPDDQRNLYARIISDKLSVRDAELAARNIARERARASLDPETRILQEKLENVLGTRVNIERRGPKGKISIEFFSEEELKSIYDKIMPPEMLIA